MALEIIFNLEPLDLHIMKVGLTAYKRLDKHLDSHNWTEISNKSHLVYWRNLIKQIDEGDEDDRCDITITDRYSKILNTQPDRNKTIHKAEFTIYTGGSKTSEGVGAGFVIYNKNIRVHTEAFSLPSNATVFQAEIEAIYQSTQFMLTYTTENRVSYI